MSRVDARLREMQFLARLEREGTIKVSGRDRSAERQMILSLLVDGYLNDGFDGLVVGASESHKVLEKQRIIVSNSISSVHRGEPTNLKISHKGRVRLSELEQQLQTGRDHDDTGLLWAKRHLTTDLAIAVLSASTETPISFVFLDMNDLGKINNTHGHVAGDEAIRAFFQAVVETLAVSGEAYRNGGDEAVVILRDTTDDDAREILKLFVRQLSKDVLVLGDTKVEVRLTASCGSTSTTDANEDAKALLKRADAVMYRAKDESKKRSPRVSAYAVGDNAEVIIDP